MTTASTSSTPSPPATGTATCAGTPSATVTATASEQPCAQLCPTAYPHPWGGPSPSQPPSPHCALWQVEGVPAAGERHGVAGGGPGLLQRHPGALLRVHLQGGVRGALPLRLVSAPTAGIGPPKPCGGSAHPALSAGARRTTRWPSRCPGSRCCMNLAGS